VGSAAVAAPPWSPLGPPGPRQGRACLVLARLISGVYLILGILGMMVTGFDHFSNVTGVGLLMFTVNPLTNLIHLVVGLVGIGMTVSATWARRFCLIVGVLGLPFAIAGFLLDGSLSDFFAANPPLNALHLATALAALGLALWPDRAAPERAPSSA
jgi:Domain of unknown function (DUF4383)